MTFYGVYDFTRVEDAMHPMMLPLLERMVVKQPHSTNLKSYTAASPVTHVSADAPPFFVLHGRNDSLVPVEQARSFVARLREVSRQPIVYAELPFTQHAFDLSWHNGVAGSPTKRYRHSTQDALIPNVVQRCTRLIEHGQKTNPVRANYPSLIRLDRTDRILLGLLAEDSSRSYVDLGRLLDLSRPAVHERVKRLKRDGVIRSIQAKLDGCKIGRTLLTFVLVTTNGIASTRRLLELGALPSVEEIHTVAGDSAVMLKVRTRDTEALEELLAHIQAIEGVEFDTQPYCAVHIPRAWSNHEV